LANFPGTQGIHFAVGVPSDAITVVISDILAIACFSSAVDVCDVPIVSAAVA
jgi:hypothetical protein